MPLFSWSCCPPFGSYNSAAKGRVVSDREANEIHVAERTESTSPWGSVPMHVEPPSSRRSFESLTLLQPEANCSQLEQGAMVGSPRLPVRLEPKSGS